jgi:signal transduction histidine kinase
MFESLRSRLWISYAFVAAVVILIIFSAVTIFAVRSNLSSRVELTTAGGRYMQNGPPNSGGSKGNLETWVSEIHESTGMRVIILQRNGDVLIDTSEEGVEIPADIYFAPRPRDPQAVASFEDSTGETWFYVIRQIDGGNRLILALPRQPMKEVLVSPIMKELYSPFLLAGGVALLLSLIFAFMISQWIVNPIQGISIAAKEMAYGKETKVEVTGPKEVKTLAKHFNHMVERLRASQISQQDLVANVSHELKTPLTSIQGFSQAIIDGTANSTEELQKSAKVIFNESSRMHRLVLDLLDLAKLDAGTVEMNISTVQTKLLLEAVIEKLSPQAKLAGVRIDSEFQAVPEINGDGDRLLQVFINLVDNAIKHTPEGGRISLTMGTTEEDLFVRVIDTGKGIDSVQLPRIFERFYQTDKARKGGPGRGVGLGLAIANEIVIAHHGKIDVKSSKKMGSEFTVFLPKKTKN